MKPFKVIKEREAFKMGDRYSVIEVDLETPYGDTTTWSYVLAKHGAVIVPIDKDGNTYLKQEWRLNRKDFAWEFASGWIDEAEEGHPTEEEILAAANRELQEEIGFKAGSLKHVSSFYLSNHIDNQFHIVIAENLSESKIDGDEHEYLFIKKVSLDEARKLLLEEQVPTAQTVIAFQKFEEILQK